MEGERESERTGRIGEIRDQEDVWLQLRRMGLLCNPCHPCRCALREVLTLLRGTCCADARRSARFRTSNWDQKMFLFPTFGLPLSWIEPSDEETILDAFSWAIGPPVDEFDPVGSRDASCRATGQFGLSSLSVFAPSDCRPRTHPAGRRLIQRRPAPGPRPMHCESRASGELPLVSHAGASRPKTRRPPRSAMLDRSQPCP